MDGCIASFVDGLYNLYGKQEYSKTEQGSWDCFGLFGWDEKKFWDDDATIDFWANLPKTPEADELVELCEKSVGRENVCVMTAPGYGDAAVRAMRGKQIWIQNNFPQFADKQVLYGKPKWFAASPWNILIDDSDSNVDKFREWGGNYVLFPRPWNRMFDIHWQGRNIEIVRDALNATIKYNYGARTSQPDWKYDHYKG